MMRIAADIMASNQRFPAKLDARQCELAADRQTPIRIDTRSDAQSGTSNHWSGSPRPGVHLQALGCRLNEAELEHWAQDFQARGYEIQNDVEAADLVVINSCAVTAEAVRKSRKLVRRAQRDNPRARLIVSGCAVGLDESGLAEASIDLLVSNADKDRLVEIASQALDLPLMPTTATEPAAQALFQRGRQRAFIKIQDGCRYQCSFCVTTRARGEERSRPIAEIRDQVTLLHAEGIQEVVLTGVHAGGYGSDLGTNLTQLIATLLQETQMPRIRLGSLEPWDLPEAFWQLWENPRLMPHLHLPLQSGSERVLKRMARRCRPEAFRALVERARSARADFNISTDLIIGFPGETDADWQQTLELVEAIGFGQLHLFAYSPRAGTRAAEMPDQVSEPVKRERARALKVLGERQRRDWLARQIGQEAEVLIEAVRAGIATGLTPNYCPVRIKGAMDAQSNQIRRVRLEALTEDGDALKAIVID